MLISFALFHQFISSIWTQKAYKNDQFTRFNLDCIFVIKICEVKNINRNMNIEQLCMNKINLTIKFNTNIRLQKKFFQIQVFFSFLKIVKTIGNQLYRNFLSWHSIVKCTKCWIYILMKWIKHKIVDFLAPDVIHFDVGNFELLLLLIALLIMLMPFNLSNYKAVLFCKTIDSWVIVFTNVFRIKKKCIESTFRINKSTSILA